MSSAFDRPELITNHATMRGTRGHSWKLQCTRDCCKYVFL